MNMADHPDRRAAWPLEHEAGAPQFDIVIRVAVGDPALLWRRAAAHLLTFNGLDAESLEATIGPREDPALAECLAVLLAPVQNAGLNCEMFTISHIENERDVPHAVYGG